jgi:hypothetical protein
MVSKWAASNRNGGRLHSGMAGAIISERWAASSRNGGRHQIGIVGDFARNPQQIPFYRIYPFLADAAAALDRYTAID